MGHLKEAVVGIVMMDINEDEIVVGTDVSLLLISKIGPEMDTLHSAINTYVLITISLLAITEVRRVMGLMETFVKDDLDVSFQKQ